MIDSISPKQAVLLMDPTARFCVWGDVNAETGWVKGNGWETKITVCERWAWIHALSLIESAVLHIGKEAK